jgi:O-antigen/teichoic acid export membrane protein
VTDQDVAEQLEAAVALPPAAGLTAQSATRTVVAQVLARAVALLAVVGSTAIVVRHIGVDSYADWATVLSIVALMAFALDPGISPVVVRRLTQTPESAPTAEALVRVRFLLSLVALVVVVGIVGALRGTHAMLLALALGAQVIPRGLVLNATPWLQLDHRLHRQTWLEAATAASGLILLAIAAAAGASAPVLGLLGFTIPTCLLAVLVRRELLRTPSRDVAVPGAQRPRVVSVLREVIPLALALVLVAAYTRTFVVFLNAAEDSQTVAKFLFSFQFIEQLIVGAAILAGAILPLLAHRRRSADLLTDEVTRNLLAAITAVGGLVSVALIALAKPLVDIIGGPELAGADRYLVLLAPMGAVILPALTLAYVYVALGRAASYLRFNIVALVPNLSPTATLTLTIGADASARICWATEALVLTLATMPIVRADPAGRRTAALMAALVSATVAAAELAAAGVLPAPAAAAALAVVVVGVARSRLIWLLDAVLPERVSTSPAAEHPVDPSRDPRFPRPWPLPRPLLALLVAALALGSAWTFVTPALQAPDENSHFGFVQYFAETGHLPGDLKKPAFSSEQGTASAGSNSDQAASQIGAKMAWSQADYERWQEADGRLPDGARSDGGGPNPASSNPPLYYIYEAPAYLLGGGLDLFGRLELARLASMLWLLVTVAGAWLLAGEVFARDRGAQLCTAGAVALAPMMQFVSASVTPDAMLFATWSLMLWLGVRLLRRGLTPAGAAALTAVAGIACVVKATSYATLPAVALCLLIAALRAGLLRRPLAHWKPAVAAGAGLLLTLGAYVVWTRATGRAVSTQVATVGGQASDSSLRDLLSYVWQFYLPRTPWQTDYPTIAHTIPVWDFALKGVWGTFGWTEILFSGPVYLVMAAITLACGVLSFFGLWRDRRRVDWGVAAFLALVAIGLLAGLHYTEYRQLKGGASNFFQGRYLLPLAPLAGLALTRALQWLPRPRLAHGIAISLGALLVLDVFSMALVVMRFYA